MYSPLEGESWQAEEGLFPFDPSAFGCLFWQHKDLHKLDFFSPHKENGDVLTQQSSGRSNQFTFRAVLMLVKYERVE